mmetsp:Transcript_15162/g.23609  ORF Transcript_15162/g.23609 Transcript_15162/m.23609 type:complete len:224 (-) Transcript_15162:379-1050(-)
MEEVWVKTFNNIRLVHVDAQGTPQIVHPILSRSVRTTVAAWCHLEGLQTVHSDLNIRLWIRFVDVVLPVRKLLVGKGRFNVYVLGQHFKILRLGACFCESCDRIILQPEDLNAALDNAQGFSVTSLVVFHTPLEQLDLIKTGVKVGAPLIGLLQWHLKGRVLSKNEPFCVGLAIWSVYFLLSVWLLVVLWEHRPILIDQGGVHLVRPSTSSPFTLIIESLFLL